MNLESISKVEDLKSLGDFEAVKQLIEKKIAPLRIEANSYNDLLDILKLLQVKWVDFIQGPFVSESAKICFVLKNMQGEARLNALGVTDDFYANKSIVKKWYKSLSNKVHSDKGGNDEAFKILKSLYLEFNDDASFSELNDE